MGSDNEKDEAKKQLLKYLEKNREDPKRFPLKRKATYALKKR